MLTFQTHHPSNLHSLNLQSSVSFCLVCRCSCQAPVLRLAGTVSQRCQGHVRSRIGSLTGSEGVGLKIRANDVNEVTKASQQYQCDPFQAWLCSYHIKLLTCYIHIYRICPILFNCWIQNGTLGVGLKGPCHRWIGNPRGGRTLWCRRAGWRTGLRVLSSSWSL